MFWEKMLWFFLAVLCAALWAVSNIGDKVLVTKYTNSPLAAMAIASLAGSLALTPFAFAFGFSIPAPGLLALYCFTVFLWMLGVILYYRAMQEAEASRVAVAYNSLPIFTLALAILFLGETVSLLQFAGIICLMLGAILVSLKKAGHIKVGKWALAVPVSAVLLATDTVVSKYVLEGSDWWSLTVLRSFIFSAFLIIGLPLYYKKVKETIIAKPRVLAVALSSESFYLVGRAAFMLSLSLCAASLVGAVTAIQPFFVLLFAVFLTKVFPSFLKEEIGKEHLKLKIAAVVLAVAGAAMVSL
ncbi:MAG: DMT family transporter [Candidatus Diapherotrites archaeon]|nr:DMT family transporter [Candidatus Diapherotrites archaeon]